jgi:hypothetical protein
MNFNKLVSFYGQYQTIPISVGSLTITNIPKYTLKFRLSKSDIYKLFLYFYRNPDTESENSLKDEVQKRNIDEEKDRSQSRVNVAYNNGAD